jgi:protein-tyrosine phosphatase
MAFTTSSPKTFLPEALSHSSHSAAAASTDHSAGYFNFDSSSSPSIDPSPQPAISLLQPKRNAAGSANPNKHIPDLTITLTPAELSHKRTKSPLFSNTTPNSSKFFDISSLGALPIKTIQEFEELTQNEADGHFRDVVIVDLRPFNAYNTSRVFHALSICIPSTLLKRPSFTISNISKTMISSQQEELDSKLESPNDLRLIFYDAHSKEDHCSFQLYQIIKKFKDTLPQYNKNIELFFVDDGFNLFKENESTQQKFVDDKMLKTSKSPETSTFSEFVLPSADASSSFLMALKTNQFVIPPDLGNDTHLNAPHFNHIERLPNWLRSYTDPNSIKTIVSNFVSIENSENQRISASVQKRLSATSGRNSPSTAATSAISALSPGGAYLFNGSENGFKNRYSNILPYEHSRVKLIPSPMTPAVTSSSATANQNFYFSNNEATNFENPTGLLQRSSSIKSNQSSSRRRSIQDDYFNANFISVPQVNVINHYIATQAPLPSTIDDFWKVVWHNETELIISLTNLDENGIKKSDVYWQDSNSVKLLEETKGFDGLKNLIVRKIQLTKRQKKRIVYQLHYTGWPDHGVTQSHQDLLDLINVKDKLSTNKDSPVLVHCSAGCGRTGTFITIDLILQAFKNKRIEDSSTGENVCCPPKPDDIIGSIFNTDLDLVYFTVQQMRKQRISMVQSLNQFILCYETLLFYFSQFDD